MKTKNITAPSPAATTLWDRLGIFGSTLCLLHCAATPFLVGVFSAAGINLFGGDHFHRVAALLLALVAFLAFLPGLRRHHNWWVFGLGVLGVSLLMVGGFVPINAGFGEVAVTVAGSLILVGAHFVNWRLTRRSVCCN